MVALIFFLFSLAVLLLLFPFPFLRRGGSPLSSSLFWLWLSIYYFPPSHPLLKNNQKNKTYTHACNQTSPRPPPAVSCLGFLLLLLHARDDVVDAEDHAGRLRVMRDEKRG
jgi:hypothetical protein